MEMLKEAGFKDVESASVTGVQSSPVTVGMLFRAIKRDSAAKSPNKMGLS